MKPRKQPRQERAKATVTAILDACAHILVNEGYVALNTNRVAEIAGVSIGSLYQYFPSKKALISALRHRHADQMRQTLSKTLESAPLDDFQKAVPMLVHAIMQAHLLEPELHRALHNEIPNPVMYDDATELEAEFQTLIGHLLRRWKGKIRQLDEELTSLLLVRLVESLVHTAVIDKLSNVDSQYIEGEIVTLVLRYLGQ